ncbi:hypothetical protein B0H13DRAFT_1884185 [Mycena leptocephala]|nr:hypothetical protein B0H13DRAFT_1884185 [Mycena leptocephala]
MKLNAAFFALISRAHAIPATECSVVMLFRGVSNILNLSSQNTGRTLVPSSDLEPCMHILSAEHCPVRSSSLNQMSGLVKTKDADSRGKGSAKNLVIDISRSGKSAACDAGSFSGGIEWREIAREVDIHRRHGPRRGRLRAEGDVGVLELQQLLGGLETTTEWSLKIQASTRSTTPAEIHVRAANLACQDQSNSVRIAHQPFCPFCPFSSGFGPSIEAENRQNPSGFVSGVPWS